MAGIALPECLWLTVSWTSRPDPVTRERLIWDTAGVGWCHRRR